MQYAMAIPSRKFHSEFTAHSGPGSRAEWGSTSTPGNLEYCSVFLIKLCMLVNIKSITVARDKGQPANESYILMAELKHDAVYIACVCYTVAVCICHAW